MSQSTMTPGTVRRSRTGGDGPFQAISAGRNPAAAVRGLPARQQPDWADDPALHDVKAYLASRPALVHPDEVRALRRLLADVARGRLQLIQAGDCAEDLAECDPVHIRRKVDLLHAIAAVMQERTGMDVIRVGRFAGQFAKPRSSSTDWHNGSEIPSFRGLMVNAPEPERAARRPDPRRMRICFHAARRAVSALDEVSSAAASDSGIESVRAWTSHEALVLDYELPQIRLLKGEHFLTSTHWPWIGERTRDPSGAHVRMLAAVENPLACKIGPTATEDEVVGLAERLDPHREPGRLTFVARQGADKVADVLPPLVRAVRANGHPVIWLCDPMHANTVSGSDGRKTRRLSSMLEEVRRFQWAVCAAGGVAGGLHLETTPEQVGECIDDRSGPGRRVGPYLTLCDPRLNPAQALVVAREWG
jgi:3-deoxy-7-phosphoheptulonate synthase